MTLKTKIAALAAALGVTAGLTLAQFPGPREGGAMPKMFGPRFEVISLYLELTEQQKQQMKDIFRASVEEAKPYLEQLRQGHESVEAAVKANRPEAELKAVVDAQAAIIAKVGLIKAKGMAKAYALLTPAQRQKLETLETKVKQSLRERFREIFQNRFGGVTGERGERF